MNNSDKPNGKFVKYEEWMNSSDEKNYNQNEDNYNSDEFGSNDSKDSDKGDNI